MTEFLRNIAEMERPRGRVLAISLAILILWTAGVMAATTPPGTTIKSQATAEYCDDNGNPLSALSNIISITTLAGSPKLKLQKIADPDPVRAGLNLVYTIQMENRGVTRLTGVVLTDPLPPETTFMSADSGGSLSADEKEVVWNIGNLEVGEKRAVTFTAQTAKDLAQGHLIKNTATIISSKAGSQKAGTITSVNARTPGEVAFFDANWQPAYGYMSGDTINIQVKDPDQNVNTSVIETVTVVLTDPATGDTETVILTETGPNTGIFRGGISTTLAATAIESGILSVAADSRIQATYTDALDALTVTSASALIDPLGIVFDSVTGDPVSGAVVTLRNWDNTTNSIDLTSWPSLPPGQVNPSAPTGADGRFAFPLVPAGDYAFQVTPPAGYTYPSAVADSDMPAGYIINIASRGGKFTLKIGDPQLISDIPVDPPMGHLTIKKTANKTTASIGDLVIYTLTLENNGASPVTNIAVKDVMPHGIAPVMGSSQMDGSAFDDPKASGNRTFTWQSPDLVPNDSFTMSYRAVVGPDSRAGNGINTASASGRSVGRTIASNKASFKIKITGGVFTDKGTIIGRVFIDSGGGQAKKDTGLPNVVLYLEDGTRVITDKSGRFSIAGVIPGTHVLRLDETSLPKGLMPKPGSNRFMGRGHSQFIDMTPGGLFKANFSVEMKESEKRHPECHDEPEATLESSPDERQITDGAPGAPLEEQIIAMTPELAILKPLDHAVIERDSTRVLVKTSTDTVLTLTVNGDRIDDSQIGRQVRHEQGRVVIYEFIGIRLRAGEENLIRAEIKDSFGIARGHKQITVETPGSPERIAIIPDRKEAAADGESRINVEIFLADKKGRVIPYVNTITVAITAGDIMEKDADPSMDGHQVLCEKGVARLTIIAPMETGEVKIHAEADSLMESASIYFVPSLREMLVVGLGEIVLGHGTSSGNISFLKDRAFYDDETYLDGRGAVFLKGKIFKDISLTAAYDSNKERTDELFRESDTRLDSEEKYPAYGDESKTGYEAMSREKLYVKLEKGKSSLLYGDYRTDLTDTKLGAYNRSFNGLRFEVNKDRLRLRTFGSYTDQSQFVDTIPARGISGFYYLNNNRIIEGSERVVIETRDRTHPDRVLAREIRSRGSDYDIDYDMGTILFTAPVSSHDSDGNPIYIVTTYESFQDGNRFYIYGGRATFKVNDRLEVGTTGIVEENGISDYRLFGGDITLRLPLETIVRAEYAATRGLFDNGSAFVPETGDGWSFDLKSKPLEDLTLTAYYQELSDYYSNLSAMGAIRGTRKWGMDAVYEFRPDLNFKAKYLDEKDNINDSSSRVASIGASKKFTKTSVNAELSRETSDNLTAAPAKVPLTPGGLLSGVPFLNAYENPDKATFLKLGVERALLPNLSLSLSHKQELGGGELSISQGGLNYQFSKDRRLYIREEYARYQEGTQARTLLGVESPIARNTTGYHEYRLSNGFDRDMTQQATGLKNRIQITDGMTANFAAEYLSTVSGKKNANEPDAYAVAAGMEYIPQDDLKVTGRAEHRHEISENGNDTYLAEVAMSHKLHPDYSLLLRERYFLEKNGVAGEDHTSRLMAGMAFRPMDNDRFNALGKIEYKNEKRARSQPSYNADSFILSVEGNYQFNPRVQLMGKYAGKLVKEDSFDSYTDLVAARILYDLTDRFDLGAEYRMLTSHKINTRLHGGSVEIGYRVVDQMWLSLGYSFDSFDADLAGDDYEGKGPFIRLRFKFDEKTLRRLRK